MNSTPRCPTCGEPAVWRGNPARPFCSIGCKLIDLGRWLDGRFSIPGPPLADSPLEHLVEPESPRAPTRTA